MFCRGIFTSHLFFHFLIISNLIHAPSFIHSGSFEEPPQEGDERRMKQVEVYASEDTVYRTHSAVKAPSEMYTKSDTDGKFVSSTLEPVNMQVESTN